MSKKGFSLIEILMVIIVLAIIFTLLAPNIGFINERVSNRELGQQRDLVLRAANMYVNDNRNSFHNGYARTITIDMLRPDYITDNIDSNIGSVCVPGSRASQMCFGSPNGANCDCDE